ncbi:MAG: GNAT family N-acetyltransferase [Alphaproteobacteria bacterium]
MELSNLEKTVTGHFKYLPQLLGFDVRESERLHIVNCRLDSSMFNVVCNTHLQEWAKNQHNVEYFDSSYKAISRGFYIYDEGFVRKKIQEVIDFFEKQSFAWWVGPSCDPYWIRGILNEMQFKNNSTEYAMACDLSKYKNSDSSQTDIVHVLNFAQLEDYINVIEPYDVSARSFYEKIKEWMLKENEKLFVGYEQGIPVVIASLYIDRENGSAAVFNLITKEDKRGRGLGTQMMHHLLNYAKDAYLNYACLLASSDSGYRIYQRLGFEELGQFDCFEWVGRK